MKCGKSSSATTALLIVFLVLVLALFTTIAVYLNNIRNLQAKGDITYISPTQTKLYFTLSVLFAGLSLVALIVVVFVNWPSRKGYIYRSTPAGSYLEEYSGSGESTEEGDYEVSLLSEDVQVAPTPTRPCRPRPVGVAAQAQKVTLQRQTPVALQQGASFGGFTKTTAATTTRAAAPGVPGATTQTAAVVKRRALPDDIASGSQDSALYAGFDQSQYNF